MAARNSRIILVVTYISRRTMEQLGLFKWKYYYPPIGVNSAVWRDYVRHLFSDPLRNNYDTSAYISHYASTFFICIMHSLLSSFWDHSISSVIILTKFNVP